MIWFQGADDIGQLLLVGIALVIDGELAQLLGSDHGKADNDDDHDCANDDASNGDPQRGPGQVTSGQSV